jgi:hypothetical protein
MWLKSSPGASGGAGHNPLICDAIEFLLSDPGNASPYRAFSRYALGKRRN